MAFGRKQLPYLLFEYGNGFEPQAFRREIIERIRSEENRFGFEAEITAKVAKAKVRIYEVGISYSGRTYAEGKKVGWRDGFRALWCIWKYNFLNK